MQTFMLVVHITVCLFLIFIVLIQGGKGAEMGAAFGGGSSQTLFGGRGAATFLGKLTTMVAVVFMLTSLILAVIAGKDSSNPDINLDTPPVSESPMGTELPAGTLINQPTAEDGTLVAPPSETPADKSPVSAPKPPADTSQKAQPATGK